jgi:hypothetical protein
MPEHHQDLLTWEFIAARMDKARYYWLNTTFPDGRPHAVPVWGIWRHDRIHFDGSPNTAWARNLFRDPRIVVHPPDPNQVVVVEGLARTLEDGELDEGEWLELDTQYQDKYGVTDGSPYWYVQPTKVIAWDGETLETMTRWIFADRRESSAARSDPVSGSAPSGEGDAVRNR